MDPSTVTDQFDDTLTRRVTQRILLGQRHSTAPKQTNGITATWHLPIFLPYGRFQQVWSGFLLVLLIYSIIETPVVIAFQLTSGSNIIEWIAFVVDLCMICDIFINFRTAYIDKYDRLRIIHEPKLIAKKYLKGWFWIDLLSSFPFGIFIILFGTESDNLVFFNVFRMLRILKLLRIIKTVKLLKVFQVNTLNYSTRQLFKLVKIFCLMLLTCHYFACIWHVVGYHGCNKYNACWVSYIEEQEEQKLDQISNLTKYTYSAYWAAVTLFTTGYGDIHANNIFEMWISVLCLLIGCVFFAYFLSVFTSWRTDDKLKQYEIDQVEKTIIFCAHYNLPLEIRRALVTHVRYGCNYNYVFDQSQILDVLPPYLQKTVQKYLAQRILSELDLFQSLTDDVIGQLVLKLKSRSCNIGHLLFERGENGRELYIQRTGHSRLLHTGDPLVFKTLKRGDICGENIIVSRNRVHSVQCETWSEFYVLDIQDILDVLGANYDPINARKQWNKIKKIAAQSDWDHVRHCKMPVVASTDPIFLPPGVHAGSEVTPQTSYLSEENALLREDEAKLKKEKELTQRKKALGFKSMQNLFKQNLFKSKDDNYDSISEKEHKRPRGTSASMLNLFGRQTSIQRNKRNVCPKNRQSTDLVMGIADYQYEFVRDDDDFDADSFELSSAGFGQQHGLYRSWSKMGMPRVSKITDRIDKNDSDNDDAKYVGEVKEDEQYTLDLSALDTIEMKHKRQSKRNEDVKNIKIDCEHHSNQFDNHDRFVMGNRSKTA